MVKIFYNGHEPEDLNDEEYSPLPSFPVKLTLPVGCQVVLYEKENFLGNSVVLSAHDNPKEFIIEETACKAPRSLRLLTDVAVLPHKERDDSAEDEALEADGWMQKSWCENAGRLEWLMDSKFGCFVHWGVYAIAAGVWNDRVIGYAEHVMRAMKISLADYKTHFIDKFNPVKFDADEWVLLAKRAGMKFFVITAKHHDGFAINVSDVYPYDIRMTPFKRDPIAELRDACERHDLPFGLYYSHAFDWEHPDAPGNDWEYTNGGGDKGLFEGKEGLWFNQHPELVPRTAKYYVDKKSIPQILELIEKYRPSLLWFDTPHKLPLSENMRILRAIREADPTVIVNGRLARSSRFDSYADYVNTGDRAWQLFPTPGPWETIPTTNESYGHSIADRNHKPPEHFIQLLIKSVARGGNVLMNLGPTALGDVEQVDIDILERIGDWMQVNSESVYGTRRSRVTIQNFGETTLKGNTLYLHLFTPKRDSIVLSGVITGIEKAYILGDKDKKPLPIKKLNYYDTEITIPGQLPAFTVIAAEFKGELYYDDKRMINSEAFLHPYDASYFSPELGRSDGKPNRDYLDSFTDNSQFIAWKLRTPGKLRCKLEVKYQSSDGEGSYSVYTDGVTHTRKVTASERTRADEMFIYLSGTKDIVFRTDGVSDLKFFGIAITPVGEAATERKMEVDDTDLGG